MKFRDYIDQVNEGEMKYQALAMAKEVHSALADLSFVEMLGVMSPDNPAKKEVQELEKKINELTAEIGDFVIKHMPDVAAAEADDVDELPPEEEEEEEPKAPAKKPAPKKPTTPTKKKEEE